MRICRTARCSSRSPGRRVNYKDALATIRERPGRADLAARARHRPRREVVVERDPALPAGTEVLAHGYDLGVAHHGGYAEYARVPADWVVPLPDGLTRARGDGDRHRRLHRRAVGRAARARGLTPGDGPVLVTGATGGVGSVAVAILAELRLRGRRRSTGKADAGRLPARARRGRVIVARDELAERARPLERSAGRRAVDCVGGATLATSCARCATAARSRPAA